MDIEKYRDKKTKNDKKWSGAKEDALKKLKELLKPIKVTPAPKGKDNMMVWDSTQEKPSFSLSSKQVENMPEVKPGDTVKIVMECCVKRCEMNEDKSSEYRLEIDKIGIV
jgi:hypothetical protein